MTLHHFKVMPGDSQDSSKEGLLFFTSSGFGVGRHSGDLLSRNPVTLP
jgi:hypothetical protein